MPLGNYITEGFDPTTIAPGGCLSLANLLQMVHAAKPASPDTGFIFISATTPDTATYPELKRFLWLTLNTGTTADGNLKYWNGASWQLITSNVSVIPGSIGYEMISPLLGIVPGTAYQVLAVDLSGLTSSWHTLPSIIAGASGSWPDDGYGTQKFITNLGRRSGVNPAAFAIRSITLDKLNSYLGYNPVGDGPAHGNLLAADGAGGFIYISPSTATPAIPPKSISIQQLESSTAAADLSVPGVDKLMAVDASGGMKWITAPAGVAPGTSGVMDCFTWAWQLGTFGIGTIKSVPHGFNPNTPNYFRATLSCQSSEYGYVTNNEIDLHCITGIDKAPAFSVYVNNTSIYVARNDNSRVNIMRVDAGHVGEEKDISASISNWAIKVYANVLP